MIHPLWIVLVLVVAEGAALHFFAPWYYRYNVALLRRGLSPSDRWNALCSVDALSKACRNKGWAGCSYVFRRLDDDTIAFRPSMAGWPVPMLQHPVGGTIRRIRASGSLLIRGFVTWWLLAIVAGLLLGAFVLAVRGPRHRLGGVVAATAIMGINVWFQLGCCRRVAAALESESAAAASDRPR